MNHQCSPANGRGLAGARVAEEMWVAGTADGAMARGVAYQTTRRSLPASSLTRKKTAAGAERPAKKKPKGREYDLGDRREAIRMYLAGEKVVNIADEYGAHERTIYKWLRVSRSSPIKCR